jgi:hypothetical protein
MIYFVCLNRITKKNGIIKLLNKKCSNIVTNKLIYRGQYEFRIRSLRRVSLISSTLSVFGLPLLIYLDVGSAVSIVGQIAISSTVIFSSVSSTLFLHLICQPYVVEMKTVFDSNNDKSEFNLVEAKRLNLLGRAYVSKFSIKDVEFIKASIHPFATFKVKNHGYFYVYENNFIDDISKKAFYDRAN